MLGTSKPATDSVRVRRGHKRASYERTEANRILDAGHVAHVGFLSGGQPVVIPMLFWRDGDFVYWHGSSASRAMEAGVEQRVCLTVTLLDGLVFAKSAFHHSANYRSVTIFGSPELVGDGDARLRALEIMMEQLAPGRWQDLRPVNDKELKATLILRMPIEEFAVKIRTGGPNDDPEDEGNPIWGGHVPVMVHYGEPIADPKNPEGLEVPEALSRLGAAQPHREKCK